jgi:hypothetical protein
MIAASGEIPSRMDLVYPFSYRHPIPLEPIRATMAHRPFGSSLLPSALAQQSRLAAAGLQGLPLQAPLLLQQRREEHGQLEARHLSFQVI